MSACACRSAVRWHDFVDNPSRVFPSAREYAFRAQGEATGRAIRLAAHVNTPLYVVHVMSKDALQEVISGRAAGYRVIGEAVASAIALTDAGL